MIIAEHLCHTLARYTYKGPHSGAQTDTAVCGSHRRMGRYAQTDAHATHMHATHMHATHMHAQTDAHATHMHAYAHVSDGSKPTIGEVST